MYNFLGDEKKALEYQNRAKILNPLLPVYCRELEAVAHYILENYHDSVSVVSQLLHKSKRACAYRVAALSHLDDATALGRAVEGLLISDPNFSINSFLKTEFYRDDDIPRQLAMDLKKAGLPDSAAA